jgi:hypothetical protein
VGELLGNCTPIQLCFRSQQEPNGAGKGHIWGPHGEEPVGIRFFGAAARFEAPNSTSIRGASPACDPKGWSPPCRGA